MDPEYNKGGARLEEEPSKKGWKNKTVGQKILRVLLIILIVLALIFTGLVVAWKMLITAPELPSHRDPNPLLPEVSGEVVDIQRPNRLDSQRKKDFFTFLVIGRDTGGGGNTDTILLAAYDVPNQKLNVMSIPRDTMVNVPWDVKRINSVYNYNHGGDEGIRALYKEIGQLVGFVPDYQVVVEWAAVGELVEAIGGVEFDVPRNMNYDDPTQDLHIHIKKGLQTLDGEAAMGVVRYRHDNNPKYGYPDGDLGRIKTQQAFLTAVVKQCLRIENVGRIKELARVFTDNVTTDLKFTDLVWFAEKAIFGGLKMEDVVFQTMPNEGHMVWSRNYSSYQSYVTPRIDELVELVNASFNPYLEPLEKSELDIMGVDKDGKIFSTTGYVEDKKANQSVPSASSDSKPKPQPDPEPTPELPLPTETPLPETSEPPLPEVSPLPGETEPPLPEGTPMPGETPAPVPGETPAPAETETPAPEGTPAPVETAPPAVEPAVPAETPAPAPADPAVESVAPVAPLPSEAVAA